MKVRLTSVTHDNVIASISFDILDDQSNVLHSEGMCVSLEKLEEVTIQNVRNFIFKRAQEYKAISENVELPAVIESLQNYINVEFDVPEEE